MHTQKALLFICQFVYMFAHFPITTHFAGALCNRDPVPIVLLTRQEHCRQMRPNFITFAFLNQNSPLLSMNNARRIRGILARSENREFFGPVEF